jgi:molecular chaperone DnaJ
MAESQRDYYEVLGVPRDAGQQAIKGAFRKLARKYHPDRSTEPDAAERFREIAEAYRVLSDPSRRAAYDRGGFAGVGQVTPEDVWAGIDFGDLFGAGGPVSAGGLFERLFGRQARPGPPRGADIQTEVMIPLTRVAAGGRQSVTIQRPGPCPSCSGTGARPGTAPRACPGCAGTGQQALTSRRGNVTVQQVRPCPDCGGRGNVIDQPCPACSGTGQAIQHEQVTIRIPAGIPEQTTLRLAGRGMPAPVPGGQPGDAYVTIRSAPDPALARRGADLWHEAVVPVPDAVLGTTITVSSLEGNVTVSVPPGTQPGAVLQIPGKGLPRYRAPGRGSLNVLVTIPIPTTLNPRQRRLYEQLREQDTARAASRSPDRLPAAARGTEGR